MRNVVIVLGLILSLGKPLLGNTLRGTVNTEKTDVYTWVSGGGQEIATLMWLNGGAHLIMAMACDDGVESVPFGAAAGLLQKFARIDAGVPVGVTCSLAVTSIDNGSKYWLSFLSETDASASGNGRIKRSFVRATSSHISEVLGSDVGFAAERQLESLKRLLQ